MAGGVELTHSTLAWNQPQPLPQLGFPDHGQTAAVRRSARSIVQPSVLLRRLADWQISLSHDRDRRPRVQGCREFRARLPKNGRCLTSRHTGETSYQCHSLTRPDCLPPLPAVDSQEKKSRVAYRIPFRCIGNQIDRRSLADDGEACQTASRANSRTAIHVAAPVWISCRQQHEAGQSRLVTPVGRHSHPATHPGPRPTAPAR